MITGATKAKFKELSKKDVAAHEINLPSLYDSLAQEYFG